MKIEMYLVLHRNTPIAAYPREKLALVYASGFSDPLKVKIKKGYFTDKDPESEEP